MAPRLKGQAPELWILTQGDKKAKSDINLEFFRYLSKKNDGLRGDRFVDRDG